MRKPIIETVILAALFAAIPFGCVKEQAEPDVLSGPLPEPKVVVSDISCTSFKVSWDAVTDAGSYTYIFNGSEEKTTRDNSLVFDKLEPKQSYSFSVKANAGNNGDHTDSKFVNIRVVTEDYSELSAPEPVLVASYKSKTIIRWNSVYGASSYSYKVDKYSGKTSSKSIEIGGLEGAMEYVFELTAHSDDKYINDSPAAQLRFTTRPESEDIPQIIMAHVETGSDYSKFNVYALPDFLYIYFGIPASYFERYSDEEIRDRYLAAYLKVLEDNGVSVATGISQYAKNGTSSYIESPLYSETTYYIVAFGVNTDGQATTPLYKYKTKTLPEATAPIPPVEGADWFKQSLFHAILGQYNASNCLWLKWLGKDVTSVKEVLTSTTSYQLYFKSDPELFKAFVEEKGNLYDDEATLGHINSEKGFTTRFTLNPSTSYTLGTLAENAAGEKTFVVNSLATKSSANYYDWVQVTLGVDASDNNVLVGVLKFDNEPVVAPMAMKLKGLKYYFCESSELSGISTDKAAEVVAAKGVDCTEAELEIINMTGSLKLSFGKDGAPLKPETDYFLLATFTESAGDSVTRFATAKTGKAEEGTKAAFGKPRARVEFNTPEMIDIYSPVVGDVF